VEGKAPKLGDAPGDGCGAGFSTGGKK